MDLIFVLSSVTYAMKARDLLAAQGIRSELTRSAAIRKERGCGYGLRIRTSDRGRAEHILVQAGINILGITQEKHA